MTKNSLVAVLLSIAAGVSFAQTDAAVSPPDQAASAPKKQRLLKKLRKHKPAQPATNPEASFDKKGGA